MRLTRWSAATVAAAMVAVMNCSDLGQAETPESSPRSASISTTAAGEPSVLSDGAIGFVAVKSETDADYEVEVVFPGEYRDFVDFTDFGEDDPWYKRTAPIEVPETVALFDSKGKLGELPSGTEFRIRFWTENDGGPHYRPSAEVTLAKSSLARPLAMKGGYAGFVLHGELSETAPTRSFVKLGKDKYVMRRLVLEGDYDVDGIVDARIVNQDFEDLVDEILETRHSEVMIVDGGP